MKKTLTHFVGACTLFLAFVSSGNALAATYTAISSGVWSNSAIWSGGNAPGDNLGLTDQVIINNGVTVTLDDDVSFGFGSSLLVDGALISGSNNNMLTMVLANISGSGEINLKRLSFGTGGTMTFSGTADVEKMWTTAGSLQLASEFNLHDSLFLDAGTLNLASGSNFTMMTGSVLRIDDGIFSASQGVFNSGNAYEVHYVGSDKATGIELSGSAISDIYIDLDDNDQELSITGNVTWNGDVHHKTGIIRLNGGSLTLTGNYESESGAMFLGSTTSNLTISTSASLTDAIMFDADNSNLNDLTINLSGNDSHVNFGNNLTIHGTLWLQEGEMSQTGGTLTLAENSEIIVEDGDMTMGGGSLSATNSYSVSYTGSESRNSALELSGSGLSELMIDLENEDDSIAVMNDLTLDGALDLSSGGLGMNGHDLTLDGSLSTSYSAWISGDEESDMTFNTNSLINDTLWFNQESNHVGMITINADDNSDLMIGNDVMVEGMTMSTGGVRLWDNTLWFATTGSITGASEDRYVVIDGDGSLAMNVQVSAPYLMYPVGTESGYAPVSLQQNSGTARYIMVGTNDGVWTMGASGDDYTTMNQGMIDRTWNIQSENTSNLNMNVMAMWAEGMEVNSFDREDAFMMQYTSSWDYASQTTAESTAAGDMWTFERENVTTPGMFAIADGSTTLKVKENLGLISAVYPNPVNTILTCEIALTGNTTAQVIDPTGKVILSEEIKGAGNAVSYAIDFSEYTNGVYFVNFENETGTASYRVVKN